MLKSRPTYNEFISANMTKGLHNLTLHDLAKWLDVHDSVYVVTDIKEDNVRALKYISERYPSIIKKVIPQIYFFLEYSKVYELGYHNIILTLYCSSYTDEMVIEFAKKYPLYAVTMWDYRAKTDFSQRLKQINIRVYAHTVNDTTEMNKLLTNGAYGVYTDFLMPRIK